ncbi:MAG: glycosyltransferase family 9 protein [Janthinobacterium lividum]
MAAGDFDAAFRASDAVLAAHDPATRDDPGLPYHRRWVWDGRSPAGRHVLVRCYHGLGDTLQFCRYLPALRSRARRVTLEAQPELCGLLRGVPGIDALHGFDPAHPLPPAECDIEIMELAHALRLPPAPTPYLHPPGPPVESPAEPSEGQVGFCWQAGLWNPARSVPPALLAPLLSIPGLVPVCLQRGAPPILGPDPLHGSMDIAAMARLLSGLAAIVTVDTMVAHLAGALGRPVFLLLHHEPDWRWTPPGTWYASVRQYAQRRPGDWSEPLRRLAGDLAGTLQRAKGL